MNKKLNAAINFFKVIDYKYRDTKIYIEENMKKKT